MVVHFFVVVWNLPRRYRAPEQLLSYRGGTLFLASGIVPSQAIGESPMAERPTEMTRLSGNGMAEVNP
jgi:hypothetical protein